MFVKLVLFSFITVLSACDSRNTPMREAIKEEAFSSYLAEEESCKKESNTYLSYQQCVRSSLINWLTWNDYTEANILTYVTDLEVVAEKYDENQISETEKAALELHAYENLRGKADHMKHRNKVLEQNAERNRVLRKIELNSNY